MRDNTVRCDPKKRNLDGCVKTSGSRYSRMDLVKFMEDSLFVPP